VVVVDPVVVVVVVVEPGGRDVEVVEELGSVVVVVDPVVVEVVVVGGDAMAEGEFRSGLRREVANARAATAAPDRQRDREGFTRSM